MPKVTRVVRGGGVLHIVGYMGRLCPKGVPILIFKLAVYQRVGKIDILVYLENLKKFKKLAAKWKEWWLKQSISKGDKSWQK